jgi:hypothetical protein
MEEELDINWIQEYETFNNFYKEKVKNISINYLFLDDKKNIEKIKHEKYLFKNPGILTKEELIIILKNKILQTEKNYSLFTMMSFNFSLNNEEVVTLNNDESIDINSYLSSLHGIDNIYWNDTINFFKNMNELYIIFIKKNKNKHTKKIYLKQHKNNTRRIIK